MDNRLDEGEKTQIRLFGPQMKDFAKRGTINKWLSITASVIITLEAD